MQPQHDVRPLCVLDAGQEITGRALWIQRVSACLVARIAYQNYEGGTLF